MAFCGIFDGQDGLTDARLLLVNAQSCSPPIGQHFLASLSLVETKSTGWWPMSSISRSNQERPDSYSHYWLHLGPTANLEHLSSDSSAVLTSASWS